MRTLKDDAELRAIPGLMVIPSREERDLLERDKMGTHASVMKPLDVQQFIRATKQFDAPWALVNDQFQSQMASTAHRRECMP